MYCPYCGHLNQETPEICAACGSSLREEEKPAKAAPSRATLGVAPRLLGREEELQALLESFADCQKQRQSRVFAVFAEIGLGKSRLLSTFAEELATQLLPPRVLFGRCAEGAQISYQPFVEVLQQRFSIEDSDDINSSWQALQNAVSELFPADQSAELAVNLGYLLQLPALQPASLSQSLSPQRVLLRSYSSLKRFLEEDASQRPIVFCLEDFHFASRETLDLLSYLASTLAEVPVFFLVSAEPSLLTAHPDWGKSDYLYQELTLQPLADAQMAGLFRDLLSNVKEIPESLVQLACERAHGNPFSLVELVWTFVDVGVLQLGEAEWVLHVDKLEALDLPRTVEGVLDVRVRQLPAQERALLSYAAVVGQTFWRDAVLALWNHENPGEEMSLKKLFVTDEREEVVDKLLESLMEKDLVVRVPVSSLTGQNEYRLRHLVLRDLLRGVLSEEQSQRLHVLAGQWLETVAGDKRSDYLEQIAEHRERGGQRERAAVAYAKAGEVAQARYDMHRAISLVEKALESLPAQEYAFRLDILFTLGSALAHLGDNDRAIEVFEQMLRCAFVLQNRMKAGVALGKIGRAERDRGSYREAIDALNRSLALLRSVGDQSGIASALDLIGSVHFRMGNYESAFRYTKDSLDLRRLSDEPRSIALSLSDLGNIQQNLGQPDEAEKSHREALDLRREIGDKEGMATSLNNLALVVYDRGNIRQALLYLEEALGIAQEIAHKSSEIVVRSNLGECLGLQGDLDGASGHLTAALQLLKESPDRRMEVELLRNLGRIARQKGEIELALSQTQKAIEVARLLGSKPSLAACFHTLGEIYAAQYRESQNPEHESEARDHFERALELLEEMRHQAERARTLMALGELSLAAGQNEKAHHALLDARNLFKKLGMREDLRRTEALLASL